MEPSTRIVHVLSSLEPTGINFLLAAQAGDPAFSDVKIILLVLCPEQPELRKRWAAQGVETVFCPPLPPVFQVIPSDTIRTLIKKSLRFLMPWRIRNCLRQLRPDIVHLHYLYYFFDQVKAAARGSWRLAVNLHNTYSEELFKRYKVNQTLPLLASQGCRWVAVSETVKRHFLLYAGSFSPVIEVIPNGVAPDKLRGNEALRLLEREKLRAAWGVPGDSVVFGGAGRLTAQKGFEVLIQAARKVLDADSRARFVIAGEGEERARLEKMVLAEGLGGRILFCGFVENMSAFYAALDVFVVSSHEEGSPLVLLEAVAAGLPCVSTRVGGASEMLKDSPDYLVAPGDAEALGRVMASMLSAETRIREQKKSINRAGALRWDHCCQAYRSFYRQLKETRPQVQKETIV